MPNAQAKIMSAAETAQRWAKAMKARAQRKPFHQHVLAPWEENTYFEPPTEHAFTGDNTTAAFKILDFNPRRVAAIFSNRGPVTCMVSIQNANSTQGWILNPTVNPFPVLQKDFGNLVQLEWFLNGLGTGAFAMVVTEVILRDWPGG